jgi:hypothetical protein
MLAFASASALALISIGWLLHLQLVSALASVSNLARISRLLSLCICSRFRFGDLLRWLASASALALASASASAHLQQVSALASASNLAFASASALAASAARFALASASNLAFASASALALASASAFLWRGFRFGVSF